MERIKDLEGIIRYLQKPLEVLGINPGVEGMVVILECTHNRAFLSEVLFSASTPWLQGLDFRGSNGI